MAELKSFVAVSSDHLRTSRPTAVNLFEAMNRLNEIVKSLESEGSSVAVVKEALLKEVESMLERDVADNKAVGAFGSDALLKDFDRDEKVR